MLGDLIDLSLEEALPCLVEGFSFREAWGRWTDGPHARIEFDHGEGDGMFLSDLFVARTFRHDGVCEVVLRGPESEPQLFTLTSDDTRITYLSKVGSGGRPGKFRLDIFIVRPKKPDELPLDSRSLGIGISSIRCRRIGAAL